MGEIKVRPDVARLKAQIDATFARIGTPEQLDAADRRRDVLRANRQEGLRRIRKEIEDDPKMLPSAKAERLADIDEEIRTVGGFFETVPE